MALREIDPPPVLAEALTPEFLRPLRVENPPAVRIARRPAGATWSGFCSWHTQAEFAEVTLHHDDPLAPLEAWVMVEDLRGTYLHEIAHRFLSKLHVEEIGGSHGPVFFAIQLLLFLRLPDRYGARPWFLRADVYDLQDAWLAREYTPGEALDWAYKIAESLAPAEISAEQAATKIALRFKAWRAAMVDAPARRAAVAAEIEQQRAALRKAEDKVLWWRLCCGAASLAATAFLFLAISMR